MSGCDVKAGYHDGDFVPDGEFEGLGVQAVKDTTGVNNYKILDHTVFVVDSPLVSTETWQGMKHPRRTWDTGSVAFLPANSEVESKTENRYDETIIRVPDKLFREVARIDIDYGSIDFRFTQITNFVVSDVADLVRRCSRAKVRISPMLMENLALSLAVSTAAALSPQVMKTIRSLRNGLSPSRKKRVLAYIEANLSRQVLLTEIAHVAALSPFHFSRSFVITMGVSPMRYVLARRIAAASVMLRTSAPMVLIALDCGFLSQGHFCTAFKASVGKTPSSYRKSWRL